MAGSIDTFVADASFVLASLLPDEESPESDEIIGQYLDGELELTSSDIFNLEVLNGLISAQLSKRITKTECYDLAERFIKLRINCEDIDNYKTFLISQETGLSVYDASYVWLARSKNVPLLSLDRRMKKLAAKNK